MEPLISKQEIVSKCTNGKENPYLGSNDLYNILYCTTCLVNGKVYVGVHSSKKLQDRYIGCGIWGDYSDIDSSYRNPFIDSLGNSVKRFGVKNFARDNVLFFDNVDDALLQEKLVVDKRWVRDSRTLNVRVGGVRPPSYEGSLNGNYGRRWTEEQKRALSEKRILGGKSLGNNNPNIQPVVLIDVFTLEVRHFPSLFSAMETLFPDKKYDTMVTCMCRQTLFYRRWVCLHLRDFDETSVKDTAREYIAKSRFVKEINSNKTWD